MKKGILIGAFCVLLAFVSGSAFAAAEAPAVTETGKAEETTTAKAEAPALAPADAALEAEMAKIFDHSDWLTAPASSTTSAVELSPSTSWVCNQGAYCTYRNDPACGPEGFCNLQSNCCMCY